MSPQDSLYEIVHAQFREAFGQPQALLSGGEQWTLQPSPEFKSSIHVLLNGSPERPGVWVFDPHNRSNGVQNTPITDRRQVSELITLIQGRINFGANRKQGDTTPPRAQDTSAEPGDDKHGAL